ncbi:hypothetical protein FHR83_008288 [Actinoplanes campanulatus]|uniref:SWIM-type domain-containing protein n=1 Tax=Actinoplanes campanulatus TaxID=113559 RepID=A0A7W5AQF9_9ACTN|nr:hypothetical protein [Actinoplanes campanulatus]MBB3100563.1 hypothetical protein [Actinoplanes campanulatus]GGN45144.1 hypothetical protein GCM10010109_79010 [Actinoplanes campanulatus]GID41005.1 hypothetical protein Aca09nite_75110 [Actinoplanes campanulatus]
MSEVIGGSVSLPVRADLRALDADALAALANRGLVKRAAREAEREPPALSAGAGATVVAEFTDGVRAELPEGGLEQGRCTCGATGACRHLLGLIFAYQAALPETAPSEDEPPAEATAWSPGGFTDEDLVTRIGSRLVETARRTHRGGYTARIRRGAVPVAELPAATVRFLVPGDLGYVHTDARAGVRDDVIALAVWAFRAADEQYPGVDECSVDVGGAPGAAVTGSGLETVIEFAAEVLRAGAVHAGPGLVAAAAGHLATLDRAGLRWPLDATAELADQVTAYRDRSARYTPERLADLIAELFARHRAVSADSGAGHRARVLGSEEAAETPLRRVRLDGLGARVTAVDGQRRVEIFHGQAASGVVLVSHRQWETDEDGPALGRRRIAGATVDAIASGALVTESAIRSASRTVRLGAGRIAKSTVTVSNGAWEGLPPGLLAYDYAKLAAELDAMPPRPVRARVRAELVRVLAIAEVGESRYAPGAQRLSVEIRDGSGVTATVEATHAAVAPGRLDAVAAALDGRRGRPRFVAGSVHRSGGRVVIDPYAIAADGPPVVPDLAVPPTGQGLGSADGPAGSADPGDPLAEAVAVARDVLAEAAHSGLAHLPGAHTDRLRSARAALARVGLHRVAASLDEMVARLGPDPGAEATRAWVDAYLRVSLAADLR